MRQTAGLLAGTALAQHKGGTPGTVVPPGPAGPLAPGITVIRHCAIDKVPQGGPPACHGGSLPEAGHSLLNGWHVRTCGGHIWTCCRHVQTCCRLLGAIRSTCVTGRA